MSLVGLDVGTTGVKAIAISPQGEVLARAEEEYPLSIPQPGWAEQDPEDWWQASERALAAVGAKKRYATAASGATDLCGLRAVRQGLLNQSIHLRRGDVGCQPLTIRISGSHYLSHGVPVVA